MRDALVPIWHTQAAFQRLEIAMSRETERNQDLLNSTLQTVREPRF